MSPDEENELDKEIEHCRREVVVESYPMSVGEIANLYRDGELDVHPEFQRYFRWSDEQKTRLIESLLLGIPLPSIFVAQKSSGVWEVIDGQQRLCTILQFMHLLKPDEDTKEGLVEDPDSPSPTTEADGFYAPLILHGTKLLKSLEGITWDGTNPLSPERKIKFKREKLNFTIIKETPENPNAKFDLFQRLNTGGTQLSPQEIRNCLLIMLNKKIYAYILSLNQYPNYRKSLFLAESKANEQYDKELVLRYLIYCSLSDNEVNGIKGNNDVNEYLTEQLEMLALGRGCIKQENLAALKTKFEDIFQLLADLLGENSFRRWNKEKNNYTGPFRTAAFEAVVPGIFKHLEFWRSHQTDLEAKIKSLYSQAEYNKASERGVRALGRMKQLIIFSRTWFDPQHATQNA